MGLHKGYRNRTRSIYRKTPRKRGQNPIDKYLIDYEIGEKVAIIGDPAQHKRGLPHRRYYGKTGTVVGTRGRCYEVELKVGNTTKMLLIGKEHLKAFKTSPK
ncbi:MAG: 50S ribosomal protein L21e [Promethearchaeota archaeon]|nr:MAG: 50S ribosomal protein L21e [Candidatus Lokiarchaeota archaeon]